MIQSEPFKKLSPYAVWVLIHFINQKKAFTREYLDHDIPIQKREVIALTYNQVLYQMKSHRYKKSLQELLDNGFLILVEPGGMLRKPNKYVLDNSWKFKDPKTINEMAEQKKKKEYSNIYESFGGALKHD